MAQQIAQESPEMESIPPISSRSRRRQERLERMTERRSRMHQGGADWLIGLVLVGLGGLFLAKYTGILTDKINWEGLLILIPAVAVFSGAAGHYKAAGNIWTSQATRLAILGVFFLMLTAVTTFSLDTELIWPVFLIAGGALLLFRRPTAGD